MSRARRYAVIFMVIAFIGFADAAFLTYAHYSHIVPPCTLVNGCEKVTTSAYSVVFGVPVAFVGALYYLMMFLAAVYCFEQQDERFLRWMSLASWLGFLASIWFVSLQLAVIHAICIYCMTSAATSTGLFVTGMTYLRKPYSGQKEA